MNTKEKKGLRENYSTPRLKLYGDLRKITKSVGNRNLLDGGYGRNVKTSR